MKLRNSLLFVLVWSFCQWPAQVSFNLGASYCTGGSVNLVATSTLSPVSYTWSVAPLTASITNPNSPLASVVFNSIAVYTVSLSYSSGTLTGVYQKTTSATFGPALLVSASLSTNTTCIIMNSPTLSKPVTLTAVGAPNYAWFPYQPFVPCGTCSTITVRPNSTTCYTVIGTNSAACTGSAIACVTVIPQFTLAVTPPNATICLGQTITLSVVNIGPGTVGSPSSFTYSWTTSDFNSISNSLGSVVNVFPGSSAVYTVDVADTRSCVSLPQIVSVQVNTCNTLSEDRQEEYRIHLFPNPAQEWITVHSEAESFVRFEIYNGIGQKIQEHRPENLSSLRLDVSELQSGLYFVKCWNSKGYSQKQGFVKSD